MSRQPGMYRWANTQRDIAPAEPPMQNKDMDAMLTERQIQILQCAANGEGIEETASRFWISTNTVKQHRKQILLALGAKNMTHAVAMAFVDGKLPYKGELS